MSTEHTPCSPGARACCCRFGARFGWVALAGYVRKDAEPETLLAAVRAVARGGTYIDPGPARAVAVPEELTPRETEVLRQVAPGLSNRAIADALSISEETVKTHVGNVLGKLAVENRAQAVAQALKRGWYRSKNCRDPAR